MSQGNFTNHSSAKKQFCLRGHDTFVNNGRDKQSRCKACKNERDTQWIKNNLIKARQSWNQKNWKRDNIINIKGLLFSSTDYDKAFILQNGKCAICLTHQSELIKSLAVDHDHLTRKFRGLLCFDCNVILGHAHDNVKVLENAYYYMQGKTPPGA